MRLLHAESGCQRRDRFGDTGRGVAPEAEPESRYRRRARG